MKKLLNKFAVWLYKQTKEKPQMTPQQFLGGLEVMMSDFIPEGKVMMGNGNYKSMLDTFLDQEIEAIKN